MQHWTWVMGRAQQMMMEHLAAADGRGGGEGGAGAEPAKAQARWRLAGHEPVRRSGQADGGAGADVDRGARHLAAGAEPGGAARGGEKSALAEKADKDRRFAAPEWRDNPLFDTIRQTYLLVSERLLGSVDAIEGVDEATREKLRFTTQRVRRRDERRPISR